MRADACGHLSTVLCIKNCASGTHGAVASREVLCHSDLPGAITHSFPHPQPIKRASHRVCAQPVYSSLKHWLSHSFKASDQESCSHSQQRGMAKPDGMQSCGCCMPCLA
jgi:hypothetical protein